VLQTASPSSIGFNGLGGITLRGRITQYEYDVDDKGPINILADVSLGGAGFATLRINVSADGSATATYTNNWGARVTFAGVARAPGGVAGIRRHACVVVGSWQLLYTLD
jgi:hypothetical protein